MTYFNKSATLIYGMTEEEFFSDLVSEWGDKQSYSIEKKEVQKLLSFGGKLQSNIDNKDGTFSLTIKLREKEFICITT